MSRMLVLSYRLKEVINSCFTYIVFEANELFISLEPDASLRWYLDQNVTFLINR